jgi:hypothetical protein
MEEVTQQNSSAAQSSSTSAEKLSEQSVDLNSIVQQLVQIVRGQGGSFQQSAPTEAPASKQRSSQLTASRGTKNNVVNFKSLKPKKSQTAEKSTPHHESEPLHEDIYGGNAVPKKVASSDYTPSSDDPGFQ